MYPSNELLKYPSWDTKYLHSTHPEILTLMEPLGGNIPLGGIPKNGGKHPGGTTLTTDPQFYYPHTKPSL